jgi:peroxiredoxin
LAVITPARAAITLEVKPGQEFVYRGTAEWSRSVTGRPADTMKGPVTITVTVTRRDDAKGYGTIQFRHFATERKPGETEAAAEAMVEVVPYGADLQPTLAPLVSSGLMGIHLRVMGVPFAPRLDLGAGQEWRQVEPISVTLQRSGEVVSRVAGETKVGDRSCWKIEKQLAQALPVQEKLGSQPQEVTGYDQTLCVDAETGRVVSSALSFETRSAALDRQIVTRARIQVTLQEIRSLAQVEREAREKQAETLTAAERLAMAFRGNEDTLKAMDTAAAEVAALQEKYPESQYAPAFVRMKLLLTSRRQMVAKDIYARSLVGKPAPEFRLKGLDGKEHSLAEYRGKRVILKFFASWCGPCHEEAPRVEQYWQQIRDHGTVIVGIDTWESGDLEGKAGSYRDRHKLTFPILVDAENQVVEAYGVTGIPRSVTIDEQGKVVSAD